MKCFKILLVLMLILSGCGKKEEEVVLEIKENEIYNIPFNPTDEMIIAYNNVTEALEGNDEVEIVKNIAIAFAYDFFTFTNKEGNENKVGGMTYVPSDKVQSIKEYVIFYFYKNIPTLIKQYGEENLPKVIDVVAVDPIITVFEDENLGKLKAYDVRLVVKYGETTIPTKSLKTDTVITIADYNGRWSITQIQ